MNKGMLKQFAKIPKLDALGIGNANFSIPGAFSALWSDHDFKTYRAIKQQKSLTVLWSDLVPALSWDQNGPLDEVV